MVMATWATRVPGMPYLWVWTLAEMHPAAQCPTHGERLTSEGVCIRCAADWYRSLGGDVSTMKRCTACRLPLHPAVISDGFTTHPTCPAPARCDPAGAPSPRPPTLTPKSPSEASGDVGGTGRRTHDVPRNGGPSNCETVHGGR